ncbi:Uma2 family endonuclease [Thermoflexibacter ruber]|uniref:Uma2 family endonuclease n=1 Tax=Thermoflexibacter ruber TaxID=1003 RepID=UPI000B87B085|nr:Uma2 family endonuclease [Thermoflexibacter ruber]
MVNPLVIVEIWSPSTDYKDRGIKMREYQSITSLQEYVIISQDEIRVEHFTRQSPNEWLYRAYEQETAQLHLSTIDVSMLLSEIYAE